MRTWVTHPDNADWLRRMLQPATRTDYGIVQRIEFPPEIMTDWRMDRTKPSGLYGLPDGRIVDLADVRADFGFISYGPEDIWYLVGMGIVHEIRVPLAIERCKPMFPVFHAVGIPIGNLKGIMIHGTA